MTWNNNAQSKAIQQYEEQYKIKCFQYPFKIKVVAKNFEVVNSIARGLVGCDYFIRRKKNGKPGVNYNIYHFRSKDTRELFQLMAFNECVSMEIMK